MPEATPWIPLAISLGSVLGALSRYYVTLLCVRRYGNQFPYGTLIVNLSGALLIGPVSVLVTVLPVAIALQKLLLVGFFGSYTTFSSYILDTANLWRDRHRLIGLGYWLGSALLGFVCAELGFALGHRWL